ncbi:MAG TPA: outer membrane beta-barrel protein [bacterium]|nr:outer membrane beta-barrel protein [bacterium]
MRFLRALAIALLASLFALPVEAREDPLRVGSIMDGFELSGYLSVGAGWQRFSNAPVTEWTNDGSFAGVLGSLIPDVQNGTLPSPGQDDAMAFVELAELDIAKSFGDRTKLRADLWFGRAFSGSWVPQGVEIEQAYVDVALSESLGLDFMLGRFATEAGFEEDNPFDNDSISWSILARTNLYPYYATGAQLVMNLWQGAVLYLAVTNTNLNDWNRKANEVPGALATLSLSWGDEENESWFTLTPFIGPESGSNRHMSYGVNSAAGIWVTPSFQVGYDAVYHRDNGFGGPNTDYAAGLINLHYDFTDAIYGFARYAYARQFEDGNGALNLTGAKPQIHEASLGGGYMVADGMKFKVEARTDAVLPAGGKTQWVPGAAVGFVCAF